MHDPEQPRRRRGVLIREEHSLPMHFRTTLLIDAATRGAAEEFLATPPSHGDVDAMLHTGLRPADADGYLTELADILAMAKDLRDHLRRVTLEGAGPVGSEVVAEMAAIETDVEALLDQHERELTVAPGPDDVICTGTGQAPGSTLADVWLWTVGGTWVAAPASEISTWWEEATPGDDFLRDRPEVWWRKIDDVPPVGPYRWTKPLAWQQPEREAYSPAGWQADVHVGPIGPGAQVAAKPEKPPVVVLLGSPQHTVQMVTAGKVSWYDPETPAEVVAVIALMHLRGETELAQDLYLTALRFGRVPNMGDTPDFGELKMVTGEERTADMPTLTWNQRRDLLRTLPPFGTAESTEHLGDDAGQVYDRLGQPAISNRWLVQLLDDGFAIDTTGGSTGERSA